MTEYLKNIDPKTLALIGSPSPSFDSLAKGSPSKSANRDALRVVNQAVSLLNTYGTPPWDRLGLDKKGFMFFSKNDNLTYPARVAHFKRVGDGYKVVFGTTLETSLKDNFDSLMAWVTQSPLRRVSFPYNDREVTLMIMHRQAEEVVRTKAAFPFFDETKRIPLPVISLSDCLLAIRTDAWMGTDSKQPRWLAIAFPNEQIGIIEGGMSINRAIVKCFDAVVSLGKEYFSAQASNA